MEDFSVSYSYVTLKVIPVLEILLTVVIIKQKQMITFWFGIYDILDSLNIC